EYIKNTFSPQHFIIPESDIEKYDLNNNFIRVVVDNIATSEVVDLRNKLLKENSINTLEIKQADKKKDDKDDEAMIDEAKSILFRGEEMLQQYVEQQEKHIGLDNLNKER